MKIISGDKKGGSIKTKKGLSTRPLQARVKKSLFSILEPYMDGAVFFDVFAGNGGVGIEALSRGIKFCYFVDKDHTCASIIKENIRHFGFEENTQVYKLDFRKAIKILEEDGVKIDIVFSGPPYPTNLARESLEIFSESAVITENSILVFETRKNNPLPDSIGALDKFREERYGDTLLSFYRKNQE